MTNPDQSGASRLPGQISSVLTSTQKELVYLFNRKLREYSVDKVFKRKECKVYEHFALTKLLYKESDHFEGVHLMLLMEMQYNMSNGLFAPKELLKHQKTRSAASNSTREPCLRSF